MSSLVTAPHPPAVVDRTDEYDPADYVLTGVAGWVVAGRARRGWIIQVALSTPGADDAWRPGQPMPLRHLRLTITAPSGVAVQYRTTAASVEWSISEALARLSLGAALVPVFTPRAAAADRDRAWAAVPIVFAALTRQGSTPQHPAEVRHDISEDLHWAAAGFTRRDRSRWSDWIDLPDVAADYRAAGFAPEEAEAWAGIWQQVPAAVAGQFETAGWTSGQFRSLTAALRANGSSDLHVPHGLLPWLDVPAAPALVLAAARAGLSSGETAALAADGALSQEACAVLRGLRHDAA